jgi:hypothetical protein
MKEQTGKGRAEYSPSEGLSLTLGYLEDPSNVECPTCGFDSIEIVGYVDANSLDAGDPHLISPDRDYSVILFCHGCERAAALHLTYQQRQDREAA